MLPENEHTCHNCGRERSPQGCGYYPLINQPPNPDHPECDNWVESAESIRSKSEAQEAIWELQDLSGVQDPVLVAFSVTNEHVKRASSTLADMIGMFASLKKDLDMVECEYHKIISPTEETDTSLAASQHRDTITDVDLSAMKQLVKQAEADLLVERARVKAVEEKISVLFQAGEGVRRILQNLIKRPEGPIIWYQAKKFLEVLDAIKKEEIRNSLHDTGFSSQEVDGTEPGFLTASV
jgi:hypothetical protein